VFLLILLGALLRRLEFPDAAFWPQAERLTYYVLFPAMLVYKLAVTEVGDTPLAPLFGSIACMLLAGSAILLLLRRQLAANGRAFTSVFQGGIRFNTYIGLACAQALYGDAGLVIAAVTVAIMIPLVNVLCVSMFHLVLHRDKLSAGALTRALLGNPLILACLLGIFLNRTGIGLSGWAEATLALLGSAALPLGLLAVGVALDVRGLRGMRRELLTSTMVRFLLMPLSLLLALRFFELPQLNAQVLFLFAVLPTASSGYILARQLGGDTVLMANITTVQTLAAFALTSGWILLGQMLWF
jgi:predicted permease